MQASIALFGATALGIAACGDGGGGSDVPLSVSPSASTLGHTTVLGAASDAPGGLAFLPNGRVTEKGGTIALVDVSGAPVGRLAGVPPVDATGQGSLAP